MEETTFARVWTAYGLLSPAMKELNMSLCFMELDI